MIRLSAHNVCFDYEIRKLLSPNDRLIWLTKTTIQFNTIDMASVGIDIGFEQVVEIHLYLIQTFLNDCFIPLYSGKPL